MPESESGVLATLEDKFTKLFEFAEHMFDIQKKYGYDGIRIRDPIIMSDAVVFSWLVLDFELK